MGSLRNPVGPLPSSIYWRRRGVVLALLAVLTLVVVWWVTAGGGDGGKHHDSGGSDGKNPVPSITPGPSGSGPAISEHPGGRDESSDGGAATGGSGGGSGSGGGAGSGGGSGDGASAGGTGGGAGSGGAQTGGGSGDYEVPAGSSLPTCTSGSVTLGLHTANSYAPGENPRLELTAKNSSGTACKIDLGPRHAVLTIIQTDGNKQFWASDDCPDSGSLYLRVPAGTSITHTVTWNRKPSAPHCATPAARSAAPGTYLAELHTPGFPEAQTSFVLAKD